MQGNNNGNQNEENNPQIPQPPQLMLQQPPNRAQMNVDQQNQPPVNLPNTNPNQQNQIQQLQNIMQVHQQQAALMSPQSIQGLHTPPTFAHSQPITSPIHFSNNPYGQFQQQHQTQTSLR